MGDEYSAVAAKLKAMHARFLTHEDFEELLSKKNVKDICIYLKATDAYGETFADTDVNNIHRGQMEITVRNEMYEEYVRLYNFIDRSGRGILNFWFMRQEIDFLKRMIRHLYTHESVTDDEVELGRFEAFFNTHTRIKRDLILNATSLSDCIAACAETPYSKTLARAENLEADFFTTGMMLDGFYYDALWRAINRSAAPKQRELFKQLIGSKIDMLNLMWIYRGKKYFSFSNELIFPYLLPVRHRLSADDISALVGAETVDKFLELVSHTHYAVLFENLGERFVEENYYKLLGKAAKTIFANHTQSLAAVYAYLYLKEMELQRITTIVEGVRYGLNTDAIRKHVGI